MPPPVRTRRTPRPRSEAQNGGPDGSRELAESEWTSDVGPGDVLSFARGGVQRRELQRLRRGRFTVEADLDLHGRIVADAVVALDRFLDDSRRRGLRCVRIVHGKGFGSRSGVPIMKAHVDRWLRERSEVLAFCSALPARRGHRRALRAAQAVEGTARSWPEAPAAPPVEKSARYGTWVEPRRCGSYRSIMVSGSHVASSGYMMRSTSTSRSRTMKGMTPL